MRRTLVAIATALSLIVAFPSFAERANPALDFSATPDLPCGPNDRPETIQGRVPLADYESGRADLGYTCNASEVSQVGSPEDGTAASGGYRVHRYVDAAGHVCAFYDTTLLWPVNLQAGPERPGVWVLDMTDPANPVHTATLRTPAMQSPHESLALNEKRGLLGAVFANPAFYHGEFDLYDVSADCRNPVLQSSLPMGVLGHEGSFAPDGNTYYASSLYGHTLTAIDTSNPLVTRTLWTSLKWNVHGMNLSEDGNLLYFADLARNGFNSFEQAGSETKGMTVLDVSQVQSRVLNPQVSIVSHLTWPWVSTPQTVLPITIKGHDYAVEVDEFGSQTNNVGAARIIDISNPAAPEVVSNMRLAVHNVEHRTDGSQTNDPNATNGLQGYGGHYCQVPRKDDPGVVACSFILSGLRVFDITNPREPVEIAYFNQPSTVKNSVDGPEGAYAMSQPAFDVERQQVWYSDGNSGFYVVQIENGVWPKMKKANSSQGKPAVQTSGFPALSSARSPG
jgi:hypothetical protein